MLRGIGQLANIGSLMKQAREASGKLNDRLRCVRATGAAGGGMIEVDVNGLGEVLAVRIDDSLIERRDKEMLEDLLPAAYNAAQQKARELHGNQLQSLAQELPLPGIEQALGAFMGSGSADSPDADPPGEKS